MEDFLEELEAIDSRENHLKTIDHLLMVYLISPEANSQQDRCQVLLLGSKLRNLFV